jgi:hypothetical protein
MELPEREREREGENLNDKVRQMKLVSIYREKEIEQSMTTGVT